MPAHERSIGELLTDLTQNLRMLFRQEIALARAEVKQSVTNARRSMVFVAAGGGVALVAALVIVAAICLALEQLGLPRGLATGIVGVVLGIAGYVLIRSGMSTMTADAVTPRATIETLKDNTQLLKGQAR
jgi:hypothetical protein